MVIHFKKKKELINKGQDGLNTSDVINHEYPSHLLDSTNSYEIAKRLNNYRNETNEYNNAQLDEIKKNKINLNNTSNINIESILQQTRDVTDLIRSLELNNKSINNLNIIKKKIIKDKNPAGPLTLNNKVTRYKVTYPIGTRDNDINTPTFSDVLDFGNGQIYEYTSERPLFSGNGLSNFSYFANDELFNNKDLNKYIGNADVPTEEFVKYWLSLPISGYYKQKSGYDDYEFSNPMTQEEYENLYNTYIKNQNIDSLRLINNRNMLWELPKKK